MAVPALANNTQFVDISGHWASDAILTLHADGVIDGYPDGTFRPNAFVTRAEAVTILNRFYSLTDVGDVIFSDVPENAWFYDQIATAIGSGYILGFEDGTFRPGANISRLHLVMAIYRILGYPSASNTEIINEFSDGSDILRTNEQGRNAVAFLLNNDIMQGYPDGTLRINNSITRAELVTLLLRLGEATSQAEYGETEEDVEEETVPLAPHPQTPQPPIGGAGGGGGGWQPPQQPQPPVCDDCDEYPCECPVLCDDCDEYPCECPILCDTCNRYPCACCPETDKYPCQCPALWEGFVIGEIGEARIEFGGISRMFNYYIPSTFNGRRLPVVLDVHGSGFSALTHFQLTNIIEVAEREGFIVIGPNAVVFHDVANPASMDLATVGRFSSEGHVFIPQNPPMPMPIINTAHVLQGANIRFNASDLTYGQTNAYFDGVYYHFDDVAYFLALIDMFVDAGFADSNRVIAQGLSSGAAMVLRLAAQVPDRFVGIAAVAGLKLYEYRDVVPNDTLRLVFMHSINDPIVPITGQFFPQLAPALLPYPLGQFAFSLNDSVAWFLNAYYGLTPSITDTSIKPNAIPDTRITTRTEFNYGAVITYVTTTPGAGHSWPGSNMTIGSMVQLQATDFIWNDLSVDIVSEVPTAQVSNVSGNVNELIITVTTTFCNGRQAAVSESFLIRNDSSGFFQVDQFNVFVNTQDNIEISIAN